MEFELNDREYLYEAVAEKLTEFGVPQMRLGFTYLLETIVRVFEGNGEICGITKTVYPALAREFCTTPQAAEKAMRTAISDACASGSEKLFLLGNKKDPIHFTNKEFIFKTVNALKKQLGTVNIDKY